MASMHDPQSRLVFAAVLSKRLSENNKTQFKVICKTAKRGRVSRNELDSIICACIGKGEMNKLREQTFDFVATNGMPHRKVSQHLDATHDVHRMHPSNKVAGVGKPCAVCFTYEATMTYTKCGHTCVCVGCMLDACPICDGDVFTGVASYTWANGDMYDGEWKEDTCHGYGKKTWKNGDVYDGDWKDGAQHGEGRLIKANGDTIEGVWKNGVLAEQL